MGRSVRGGAVRRTNRKEPPAILIVEDDEARSSRRLIAGVTNPKATSAVCVRVHRVGKAGPEPVGQRRYRVDRGGKKRIALALDLLDKQQPVRSASCVIVAGATYGSNQEFLAGLIERDLNFAVEIRPTTSITLVEDIPLAKKKKRTLAARKLLRRAEWKKVAIHVPGASTKVPYFAADLGTVRIRGGALLRLVAAQTGAIHGLHRGTVFFLTKRRLSSVKRALQSVGWARWIRPAVRRRERNAIAIDVETSTERQPVPSSPAHTVAVRANIHLSRQQDESRSWETLRLTNRVKKRDRVFGSLKRINVVELFAGAGGMGLGFLLASDPKSRYRLVYSGEAHPIYARTLKQNHARWRQVSGRRTDTPADVSAVDLRKPEVFRDISRRVKECGGAHLLIGGPPCQGFSNANRNSWHRQNPNNQLVRVFLRYVEALKPAIFLMENVQGILWTPPSRRGVAPNVVGSLARKFAGLGYIVFPKLLDAVWYGVPQHRSRFFLLGIRTDLGYTREDFGEWGPFPLPTHGPGTKIGYATVDDAIADLPAIGNGEDREHIPYCRPTSAMPTSNEFLRMMRAGSRGRMVSDHVTSKHADYVIDRYRAIPAGQNWEAIADKLTNYTAVERTHSNIYRRLTWEDPAITIGHYRKSMLIHPDQHRGLSLREASRLQSFPDWFRFAGSTNDDDGGLVHKQQQLANAVCPLVTKAIAEFLLGL